MTEKYEQAIKETFEFLEECLEEQDKLDPLTRLESLGIDKKYVIESQMRKQGFIVKANYDALTGHIIVCPHEINLPIHLWKEK